MQSDYYTLILKTEIIFTVIHTLILLSKALLSLLSIANAFKVNSAHHFKVSPMKLKANV